MTLTRYAVILEDRFPVSLPISPILPGVTAQIINASRNHENINTFDVTSTIEVDDVSVINGWSFKCSDTNRNDSKPLHFTVNELSRCNS